ncbi:MAG: hypothetical protein ABMA13_07995 [Chthoniobacteraceae bacterium]
MRLLVPLLCLLATAHAHPLIQNSMWIVFAPDRVRVAVNVSQREILVAQQVGAEITVAPDAATQKHGDYLVQHLVLNALAQPLTGRVEKITPPVLFGGDPEQTFYQYELDYALPPGPPPTSVTFTHTMLSEWPYAPGQSWDVMYIARLKRSDQADVSTGLLRANSPQDFATGWTAPAAKERTKRPAWIYAAAALAAIACLIAARLRSRRSSPPAQ